MSIIRQLTEAEADLHDKENLIREAGEATHHLARVLVRTNAKFWSLPDERLLAVLNADITSTFATFAANTTLGTAVNASLDALSVPAFVTRAPVEPGRSDIGFDGSAFFITPPVETEAEL